MKPLTVFKNVLQIIAKIFRGPDAGAFRCGRFGDGVLRLMENLARGNDVVRSARRIARREICVISDRDGKRDGQDEQRAHSVNFV